MSALMEGMVQQLSASAVIKSFRRFREKYFTSPKPNAELKANTGSDEEDAQQGALDSLPVDLQFLIMNLLSPADICRLGATSRYWRAMVRDPLLWRYFLVRDMPSWASIDHLSMPRLDALYSPLCAEEEEDRLEGFVDQGEKREESKHDFMSDYLRACPACRQRWSPPRPPYEVVTSFLQSLVPATEPRYAMFGPGMEQLDISLVTKLMNSPDILPVVGIPQRQINGIGSGISYLYKNQHKLNILTLYSTNKAERERARLEHQNISDKLFIPHGMDELGCQTFIPGPQVQQVCQVVDGFIYVANAEPGTGEGQVEGAKIRVALSHSWGPASRPLLVLSCVAREGPQQPSCPRTRWRTPCVEMAQMLSLPQLPNPWMVQDTVTESLSGLLNGLSWLLSFSGVKLYST